MGKKSSSRERDPQHVVDEGEEQILKDVAHSALAQPACFHNAPQVALYQSYPTSSIATSVPVPMAIPT
jgi:hypothetical protein